MTQLHFFCQKGMTSSVLRMLNMKSIDVEAREGGKEDGMTCLMTAARFGRLDICRLLIENGAQMEAKYNGSWSPLHWAVIRGDIQIICLLCDRGADIEAQTKSRSRPLHIVACVGHISS